MQRSLSLTYRILCIWIWIRDCNWDWDWHWVGHSRMQLDKYAFGSNYTQKERTAAVVAHAHRVQAGRTGQVGQQQQQHWQYRYNVEDQDWPGPVDPNSDCGCADNPFRHVDTYKRLYNYTAWKCDCQLVRTGQWKGRKLNCIKIFCSILFFTFVFLGTFACERNERALQKKYELCKWTKVKRRNFEVCEIWKHFNSPTLPWELPSNTLSASNILFASLKIRFRRLNLHITNLRRTQANDKKLSQR